MIKKIGCSCIHRPVSIPYVKSTVMFLFFKIVSIGQNEVICQFVLKSE